MTISLPFSVPSVITFILSIIITLSILTIRDVPWDSTGGFLVRRLTIILVLAIILLIINMATHN